MKRIHYISFIAVGSGLLMANFLFQAFYAQNWGVAAERSFFQIFALLAVWFSPKSD